MSNHLSVICVHSSNSGCYVKEIPTREKLTTVIVYDVAPLAHNLLQSVKQFILVQHGTFINLQNKLVRAPPLY